MENDNRKIQRYKEILKDMLTESGWHDMVRHEIRQELKENQPSYDKLYEKSLAQSRALIPTLIKRCMLQLIKDDILKEAGFHNTKN